VRDIINNDGDALADTVAQSSCLCGRDELTSPESTTIETVGGQSVLTGSLRIPDNLAAGNYTMELLAYDGPE